MEKSRGVKALKGDEFGRNGMTFTGEKLPEDQGGEKGDSINLGFSKMFLGESLLYFIIF